MSARSLENTKNQPKGLNFSFPFNQNLNLLYDWIISLMIISPAIVCCLGPTYYQVSRADHQRSGQARRFKDNRVILSSRLSVLVTNAPSVYLVTVCILLCRWSCSKSPWRSRGRPPWAGGRGTSCAGWWSSSGIRCHPLVIIVTWVFCRIFGFYASGFILIVISLDRWGKMSAKTPSSIMIMNKQH